MGNGGKSDRGWNEGEEVEGDKEMRRVAEGVGGVEGEKK